MSITIAKAVGLNASNLFNDVIKIQWLLNHFRGLGTTVPLSLSTVIVAQRQEQPLRHFRSRTAFSLRSISTVKFDPTVRFGPCAQTMDRL